MTPKEMREMAGLLEALASINANVVATKTGLEALDFGRKLRAHADVTELRIERERRWAEKYDAVTNVEEARALGREILGAEAEGRDGAGPDLQMVVAHCALVHTIVERIENRGGEVSDRTKKVATGRELRMIFNAATNAIQAAMIAMGKAERSLPPGPEA